MVRVRARARVKPRARARARARARVRFHRRAGLPLASPPLAGDDAGEAPSALATELATW